MQLPLLGDGIGGCPVQAVLGQVEEHLEGSQQLLLVVAHVVVVAREQMVHLVVPLEEVDDLDDPVVHQRRSLLPQDELPSADKGLHQVNGFLEFGAIQNLCHVRGMFQQFGQD